MPNDETPHPVSRAKPLTAFLGYSTLLITTTVATAYAFDRQASLYLFMCFLVAPSYVAANCMRMMREKYGNSNKLPSLLVGALVAVLYLTLAKHEWVARVPSVEVLPMVIGFFLVHAWHRIAVITVRVVVWNQFDRGGSFEK